MMNNPIARTEPNTRGEIDIRWDDGSITTMLVSILEDDAAIAAAPIVGRDDPLMKSNLISMDTDGSWLDYVGLGIPATPDDEIVIRGEEPEDPAYSL